MSAVSAAPVVCVSALTAPAAQRACLIRAAVRALAAYDRACVLHSEYVTSLPACAPAVVEMASARCKERVRAYSEAEHALAQATGLPASSVYNALCAAYPFCPASLLIVNLPAPAAAPRRFLRPARLRSPLLRPARHKRVDKPIAYLPTCKGMGLAWPGTAMQTREGGRAHV